MTAIATERDLELIAAQDESLDRLRAAGIPDDIVDDLAADLTALQPLRAVDAFEECHGPTCGLWVEAPADDDQPVYCSDACRDARAEHQWEANEERRHRAALDAAPFDPWGVIR